MPKASFWEIGKKNRRHLFAEGARFFHFIF